MHRCARSFLLAAACGAHLAHAQAPAMPVGFGPHPVLPAPDKQFIPTVNVAPVQRWTAGQHPAVAAGLAIRAYARGLDHPRWLYVLPNGDVLVAETNAPPKPDDSKGIKGAIMQMQMKKAGAATPSANRITLLRGMDSNGVAQTRSVFLQGLNSPFGMALVGNELYIANADALMRFPYETGQSAITAPGVKVMDLPGGPINHHWTKNVIASADGQFLYVAVGSNSNAGENGMAVEEGRAAIWQFTRATGKAACMRRACAIPSDWPGSLPRAPCGRPSMSATSWATTSCPTT